MTSAFDSMTDHLVAQANVNEYEFKSDTEHDLRSWKHINPSIEECIPMLISKHRATP